VSRSNCHSEYLSTQAQSPNINMLGRANFPHCGTWARGHVGTSIMSRPVVSLMSGSNPCAGHAGVYTRIDA
jgi:hypothetical protein